MRAKWMLGAVLLAALAGPAGCSDSDNLSTPSNLRHMKQATFGCISKDAIDGIIKMDAENDQQAALAALNDHIANGECRQFDKGETVYFEDFSWGLSKIRPAGDPSGYWVTTETIGVTDDAPASAQTVTPPAASESEGEPSQSDSQNRARHIGMANFGCTTIDTYNSAVALIRAPQTNSSKEKVDDLFNSGKCIELDVGAVVYPIEETAGRIKVRPDGEATAYWTMRMVVEP